MPNLHDWLEKELWDTFMSPNAILKLMTKEDFLPYWQEFKEVEALIKVLDDLRNVSDLEAWHNKIKRLATAILIHYIQVGEEWFDRDKEPAISYDDITALQTESIRRLDLIEKAIQLIATVASW